ncbi:MAG TPA: NAD-dependent epimerase/dehydratase family protein [Polyangiaceae bacterium]|jgi:nucleoside-diphosphate-sugar epimerase|nr:NAD-dependent epimerase/dehydratase family protein [Polyangiaceae bacterium]
MRVFITGATGFIGRHLCQRLVERGDVVTALVRNRERAKNLLPAGVNLFEGDLASFATPGLRLPECDVVIHLAGVVAATKPEDYDATNHKAVVDLLRCLGEQSWAPRRFVFASSLAAAGPSRVGSAFTEQDALAPIDLYGAAKARAEAAVREAPFRTTIFRPSIVLGAGDTQSLTLFKSARAGVGLRVGRRAQQLSFIDVRDLAQSIVLMAEDPRPGSFTYFASHPRATDVVELWHALGRAVGKEVLVVPCPKWLLYFAMRLSTAMAALFGFKNQLDEKQYLQMAAPAFVCSSERLRTDLGWQPKFDLDECLAVASADYRAAGWLRASARHTSD